MSALAPSTLAAVDLEAAAEDYLRAADDLTLRGMFCEAAELLDWHERAARRATRPNPEPAPSSAPRSWIEHETDVLFREHVCGLATVRPPAPTLPD